MAAGKVMTEVEFHAVVKKVEERFQGVYSADEVGGTGTQAGKIDPQRVSTGWWVTLQDWPVSIRFGSLRPHIAVGDTLIICMKKREAIPAEPTPTEKT